MGDRKGTPLPYGKNAVRRLTLVEFIPIQSGNQQNIGFELEKSNQQKIKWTKIARFSEMLFYYSLFYSF